MIGAIVNNHIGPILLVTGLITASSLGQFLAPGALTQRLAGMELRDPAALFWAQHWGFIVFVTGAMMVAAACVEAWRLPIIILATVNKTAFCALGWQNRGHAFAKRLLPAFVFDAINIVLFSAYLLGA